MLYVCFSCRCGSCQNIVHFCSYSMLLISSSPHTHTHTTLLVTSNNFSALQVHPSLSPAAPQTEWWYQYSLAGRLALIFYWFSRFTVFFHLLVKTPQTLLVFTWNLHSCFWETWRNHIQSWLVQRRMQTEGALMKLMNVFISPRTTTPPPAHRYLSQPVGLIHICLAAVFITGTASQQTDNYPFCWLSVRMAQK